jgi:hypothetical protein
MLNLFPMTFRQRTLILTGVGILAIGAYAIARFYSTALVSFVVEEALIQKAPAGSDNGRIRVRFHDLIQSLPDHRSRQQRLMEISQYLEKIQRLDPAGLERLLD